MLRNGQDRSLRMWKSSDRILRQYRIILSADTASEVRQLPERCLSRKAGIVRCCLKLIHKAGAQAGR